MSFFDYEQEHNALLNALRTGANFQDLVAYLVEREVWFPPFLCLSVSISLSLFFPPRHDLCSC